MTHHRRYTRTEAPARSFVSVCALRRTAGSHMQRRQTRAHGSGVRCMSHARLSCCAGKVARAFVLLREYGVLRQQCDLVSCFNGTFCGEWTVVCIRARCLLTRTTLRFVTLRRRQPQFIVYTYTHTRARLSCCSTRVDFCLPREVFFVLSFFPLSFPRLCESLI